MNHSRQRHSKKDKAIFKQRRIERGLLKAKKRDHKKKRKDFYLSATFAAKGLIDTFIRLGVLGVGEDVAVRVLPFRLRESYRERVRKLALEKWPEV